MVTLVAGSYPKIRKVSSDQKSLSAGHVPAEAAGMAEPLRLGEISLTASQGAVSPFSVLDIEADAIPFGYLARIVAQRYATDGMP